jgi:hypothetical protein
VIQPTLWTHEKFLCLAATLEAVERPGKLKVSGKVMAVGHLGLLWEAAYKRALWQTPYARGNPRFNTQAEVEEAAEWDGAPGDLLKALLSAGGPGCHGFIDAVETDTGTVFEVHDFWDHALAEDEVF